MQLSGTRDSTRTFPLLYVRIPLPNSYGCPSVSRSLVFDDTQHSGNNNRKFFCPTFGLYVNGAFSVNEPLVGTPPPHATAALFLSSLLRQIFLLNPGKFFKNFLEKIVHAPPLPAPCVVSPPHPFCHDRGMGLFGFPQVETYRISCGAPPPFWTDIFHFSALSHQWWTPLPVLFALQRFSYKFISRASPYGSQCGDHLLGGSSAPFWFTDSMQDCFPMFLDGPQKVPWQVLLSPFALVIFFFFFFSPPRSWPLISLTFCFVFLETPPCQGNFLTSLPPDFQT